MPRAHEMADLMLVECGDDPQGTKLFNAFVPILHGGVDIASEPLSVGRPRRGFCLGICGRPRSIVNSEINWKMGVRKGNEVH